MSTGVTSTARSTWCALPGILALLAAGCGGATNGAGSNDLAGDGGPPQGTGSAGASGAGGGNGAGGTNGAGGSGAGGASGGCAEPQASRVLSEYPGTPGAIAVDATHVYWVGIETVGDSLATSVMRVAREGGTTETLYTDFSLMVRSLAVDETSVYWPSGNDVRAVAKGGGDDWTIGLGPDAAIAVAVAPTGVYWATSAAILKVPLAGGNTETLVETQDGVRALAVDSASVYWVTDTAVRKVALGGGAVTTLASTQPGQKAMAVDGASVYWGNLEEGTVMKVSLDGGTPATLATGQDGLSALALDAEHVYWTTSFFIPLMSTPDGHLYRVPKGGGTPARSCALGPTEGLEAITIDGPTLFYGRSDMEGGWGGFGVSAYVGSAALD